jgi:hypothetical protein
MDDSRNQIAELGGLASVADDERHALLQKIAELIAEAKTLNMPETAFLLKMAHLDLQTKIYRIDDAELQTFIGVVRSSIEQ